MLNSPSIPLSKTQNYVVLISAMILGSLLALVLGKDLDWDLADYHFYNPYALLHFRYFIDYWPAAIGTFLNPTLDLFPYFLINYLPQMWVGVILGATQGITIWLLFRISLLFLPHNQYSIYLAGFFALLGTFCPQFICGIGMCLGDLIVGIFVLTSIYFSIKWIKANLQQFSLLFVSGFTLGLGVGLKLTVSFYLIASGLTFLLLPSLKGRERFTCILLFGFAALFGILCTSGLWMLFLWSKFHNPFFPFFNGIFHGHGFPEINWHEMRFYPKTLLQTVFFPFYFSENGRMVDDIWFRDYRFAFAFILYVLAGIKIVAQSITRSYEKYSTPETWFILFVFLSYIVWEWVFSFMRYAVILEMLMPLVIYILVNWLSNNDLLKLIILIIIYAFIMMTMVTNPAERGQWNTDNYFGIDIPKDAIREKNASVLFPIQDYNNQASAPLSLAYVIPYFPETWRFIGTPFSMLKKQNNTISYEIQNRISASEGAFYILVEKKLFSDFYALVSPYFSVIDSCYEIKIAPGVRRQGPLVLCRLKK